MREKIIEILMGGGMNALSQGQAEMRADAILSLKIGNVPLSTVEEVMGRMVATLTAACDESSSLQHYCEWDSEYCKNRCFIRKALTFQGERVKVDSRG